MRELLERPRRFSELKKALIGITSKTLSERLQELAEAEVIFRRAYPEVPVRVVYSLTEKGEDFDQILESVRIWGEKWMPV